MNKLLALLGRCIYAARYETSFLLLEKGRASCAPSSCMLRMRMIAVQCRCSAEGSELMRQYQLMPILA